MNKNKNNITIEELTFRRIKSLGPDEPSADFTQKVMQSISWENRSAYSLQRKNYFWMIGLISVIIIIGGFFLAIFQWPGYIDRLWVSLTEFLQPILNSFQSISVQLRNLSIQTTILISFIAIFSLLIIDEFVKRIKHIL